MHFHSFLNPTLDKVEWSVSGPSSLTSGKRAPGSHWLPELTGRYGEENYRSFLDSNFQSSSRSLITTLPALSRFRNEYRKKRFSCRRSCNASRKICCFEKYLSGI